MKRAFYVGNFAKPQNSAAGKRVYNNATMLVSCGYDVLLIGTDSSNTGTEEKLTEHISYVSFPNYGKHTGWKYFNWLKKYMETLPAKPDMLIRYGSPGLALFDYYVYRYAKKQHIPLVVDVVDWLAVDGGNIGFRCIKWLDTWLEKALFNKRGDGLIAISSYLFNYYAPYFKHKIIIPPLVEKYTISKDVHLVPQVIYAGMPFRKGCRVRNVHALKDRLDLIVTTFATLAAQKVAFDLHIVGITQEEYLTAFPEHGAQVRNIPNIHFHGRQTMAKTQEMLCQMDFAILLRERNRSTMAGFPTKVVESLSLGVPVITTDTSDLAEYIQHGKNGFLVHVCNEHKLQEELKAILCLPADMRKKLKTNVYANQAFCYTQFVELFKTFLFRLKGDK